MKIALLADTHFGARNDNLNFNEYFYNFYEGVFFVHLGGTSQCNSNSNYTKETHIAVGRFLCCYL